jgi:hypothetical protein
LTFHVGARTTCVRRPSKYVPAREVDVRAQLRTRRHRVHDLQVREIVDSRRNVHLSRNRERRQHVLVKPFRLDPSSSASLGFPLHPERVLARLESPVRVAERGERQRAGPDALEVPVSVGEPVPVRDDVGGREVRSREEPELGTVIAARARELPDVRKTPAGPPLPSRVHQASVSQIHSVAL